MIDFSKIDKWQDLNLRQQEFVLNYIKTKNGAESARLAGYAGKNAAKTASTLLKDGVINSCIAQIMKAMWNEEALSLEEAQAILARKARANIADVLDSYGNVSSQLVKLHPHAVSTYSVTAGEFGTSYNVRAADQIKAIELAMKLAGHLDKKEEKNINVGGIKIVMEGI